MKSLSQRVPLLAAAIAAALILSLGFQPVSPAVASGPVIVFAEVRNITSTGASLEFESDVPGTYFYLVFAAADSAPDAATIIAQGTAVSKATGVALGEDQTAQAATGLSPSTAYKLYLVVRDTDDVVSAISTLTFTTLSGTTGATGGKAGVGEGASVGDTLVATAWEMYVDDFTITADPPGNSASPWGPVARDVYSYRIAKTSGSVVDFQARTGLTGLTADEQSQWYVDAGLGGPAYEFDWFVFGCSAAIVANSEQAAGDVLLNEVAYKDIEGAGGFPSFTETQYTTWLGSSLESRFSAYDSPPNASLTTNVQTNLSSRSDPPGSGYPDPGLLAASYLDFSCPAGRSLFIGEILQGPGETAAVAKNLQIESVMSVDIQGTEVTVAMADTYVGVTGGGYAGANAALWGVTYINSTSSGSAAPTSTATALQTTITPSGTNLTVNLNKTRTLRLAGSNLNLVTEARVGGKKATINFAISSSENLVISKLPLLPSGKYTLTLLTPAGLVAGEVEVVKIAKITRLRGVETSGKLGTQVRSVIRKQNLTYASAGTLRCWGVTTSVSSSSLTLAQQKAERACAYAKRLNPALDVVASSRTGSGKPARNQVVKIRYLK